MSAPAGARRRDDVGVVALAAATWLGAHLARPVPAPALVTAVLLVAVGLVGHGRAGRHRRPAGTRSAGTGSVGLGPVGRRAGWALLVVAGTGVLASALGARAWVAVAPVAARPFDGTVVLVTDPDEVTGSVRAEVADGDGRYELWARGPAGRVVAGRLAGERVAVRGALAPRPASADWLARRRVVGRLQADEVRPAPGVDPPSALANGFRRLLARGAAGLPEEGRVLFAGFVLGDDRGQADDLADAFRASGLSHLLVVSGENVAFVLVVVRPLAGRLGRRARFGVVLGALALFALLTRFEPSVLRATAMAAVAALGGLLGREVGARRALALAVTGLLLVDPLLAGVLGFALSVAASAGIIVGARPLAARLPGPRVLADAVGVTVAAQLAVAPVLLPAFGSLPLLTLPANVVAAPAAGPVMVWGLTAGVVAGLAGGPVAAALHLPTRLLLGWVATVARTAAAVPVGDLRAGHVAALAVGVALALGARRAGVRRAGGVAVAAVVLAAALGRPVPPIGPVELGGARLWSGRGGAGVVVEVDGRTRARELLGGLRAHGVRRIDLLVARTPGRATGEVVATVGRALPVVEVLGPPGNRFGAMVPAGEEHRVLGGRAVTVAVTPGRLEVAVAGPTGDAGPDPG